MAKAQSRANHVRHIDAFLRVTCVTRGEKGKFRHCFLTALLKSLVLVVVVE